VPNQDARAANLTLTAPTENERRESGKFTKTGPAGSPAIEWRIPPGVAAGRSVGCLENRAGFRLTGAFRPADPRAGGGQRCPQSGVNVAETPENTGTCAARRRERAGTATVLSFRANPALRLRSSVWKWGTDDVGFPGPTGSDRSTRIAESRDTAHN
jgi:hypothetical protein